MLDLVRHHVRAGGEARASAESASYELALLYAARGDAVSAAVAGRARERKVEAETAGRASASMRPSCPCR